MHRVTNILLALWAALWGAGCISLGPTPGLTFNSAVPASRPGAEVSAAIVPGYFLSSAVTQPTASQPSYGTPMLQLSILVDPASWLHDAGFSAGARVLSASDGFIEPEVRYRHSFLDADQLSVGATLSGTYVSYRDVKNPPLAYSAGRGTLEAGAEYRVTPPWWLELRAIAGGSATALSASGTWCADPDTGHAVTCPTNDSDKILDVSGSAAGVFWSGYAGLAADVFRHQDGFFHFARVAAVVASGTMPTMNPTQPLNVDQPTPVSATQGPGASWAYWGASITVAFGAAAPAATSSAGGAPSPQPALFGPPAPEPDPANVRGQVRGPGGGPLSGATVQVVEAQASVRTNEKGAFQLHVPAGRYTVRFEAPGMVPQTKKDVAVTAGEQALFFVDLAPAAP